MTVRVVVIHFCTKMLIVVLQKNSEDLVKVLWLLRDRSFVRDSTVWSCLLRRRRSVHSTS